MKKRFFLILVLFLAFGLAACGETVDPGDEDPIVDDLSQNVTLDVAINFAGTTFISYNRPNPYDARNGKTYATGDILPVWEEIGSKFNITFVDKATSSDSNTNNQFTRMSTDGFAGVDMINGTGAGIAEAGMRGEFVNLNAHMDKMPNLSAFLEANPSVRSSMTSANGAIYFAPYFDGFQEIERMNLMRLDWVRDILDAESPQFDTTTTLGTLHYQQLLPATLDTNITVANPDGTTRVVRKNYTENIIAVQNALAVKDGASLAQALRDHIDATYGTQYAKRSDLFIGTDAAYDADEMVALMRAIKTNPLYLTNGRMSTVEVYFPRDNTEGRLVDGVRLSQMFGARGVESRTEGFFFEPNGKLADGRALETTWDAVDRVSQLYKEGLIIQNPELGYNGTTGGDSLRGNLLRNSHGFMTYDFNATSTAIGFFNAGKQLDPDMEFQAVLPPVNNWLGDGNYFHFSESVRSLKSEAWGIPAHVTGAKLSRALMVVDYLYSVEGEELFVFGPEEWRDGYIDYAGGQIPKIHDEVLGEIQSLTGGSHINYYRWYLGATMPVGHIRTLGLEFQTLSPDGIAGIQRINTAVEAGTFKLASLTAQDNPWFEATPAVFALTQTEASLIALQATYRDVWANSNAINMIKYGFGTGNITREEYRQQFMNGTTNVYTQIYLPFYEQALNRVR